MPKNELQKLWYKSHKDKKKQYQEKYMKDKVLAGVVLEKWIQEEINKVKASSQTYGSWIRELVEDWARQQKESSNRVAVPDLDGVR